MVDHVECLLVQAMLPEGFPFHQFIITEIQEYKVDLTL